MKWRLVVILAVAAVAAVAVLGPSASGSGSRSDAIVPVLRVGISPPFEILDSARVSTSTYVLSAVLEQLLQIGPDGKLKPWLADRVTQPGKAEYVYHLRKGVKFSDGTPLTPADIANAINYYRDPGSLNSYLFP